MKVFFYLMCGILVLSLLSFEKSENNYLVVSSLSEKAVEGGMNILANDGSAMDAALSVALSSIAAKGGKFVSYAGILNLVYYEAATGKIYTMNASLNSVLNEDNPLTIPRVNKRINDTSFVSDYGRTILVPGFMKGVEAAHKRFGKIPFEEIFSDAISIASEGIQWKGEDEYYFREYKDYLTRYPETKSIFTKSDGSFYKTGDVFKQPELAETLEKISKQGADYMYKGEWAQCFVEEAAKIGSKITLKDMENYNLTWSEPVIGNYNGYEIYMHDGGKFASTRLIETLNIAELTGYSKNEHNTSSPESLNKLYDILLSTRYATYNPEYFESNIDFSTSSRVRKETSKQIWEKWQLKNCKQKNSTGIINTDHSSAVVAIDKQGNMVAILHTINTYIWGQTGLFIKGVSIPDIARFRQSQIYNTGAGRRLPDGTIPGIVMKDGKPVLGFSCIGPGLHNQSVVSLINILDYNIPIKKLSEIPAIGQFEFINDQWSLAINRENFSDSLVFNTDKQNLFFHESKSAHYGFWSCIYIDNKNNKIYGTDILNK